MKQLSIKRWFIVFFVMSVISGILLCKNITNLNGSTTKINLLNLQRDSLSNSINSLNSKIKDNEKRVNEIYNNLKTKTKISDSIKIVLIENKDSLVNTLKVQKKMSLRLNEKFYDLKNEIPKQERINNKLSIRKILLVITTILFIALSIIKFVQFSAKPKIFKSKKMNQNTDNIPNTNQRKEKIVHENANLGIIAETNSGINSEPYSASQFSELKSQDVQSCIVERICNSGDAEISNMISPDSKDVHPNNGNIMVDSSVTRCGKEDTKQGTIDINPHKEHEVRDNKVRENTEIASLPETGNTTITQGDEPAGGGAEGPNVKPNKTRVFTSQSGVVGISYQGDNHVKQKPSIPCQDCHSFTKVNDIWSVAVVSDGAGSKKHSEIGSNAVCLAFTFYLSKMLTTDKRLKDGDIPDERIWDLEFRSLLNRFQNDLKTSEKFKTYGFENLAATIIILAYSPKGYLFAHVGDGRAGVKVNGEWKAILTPHKGEEANQTIFSTTIVFINKPTLMMSGVFVPETKVLNTPLEAFVLMSDGCEDGSWVTYQKVNLPNGDYKVEDVNQPRVQTLDKLMDIIDVDSKEQEKKLIEIITTYNKGFKTEGDDKTILIGKVK